MKFWILVADESRARVFSPTTPRGPLQELEGFVHTASRMSDRELVSDRPGQVRTGRLGQTVMPIPPHTDAKHVEAGRFAADLAKHLRDARRRGAMDCLALVAAPKFLGMLREALDEHTARCVIACEAKNMTRVDARVIRPLLREVLAAGREAEVATQRVG